MSVNGGIKIVLFIKEGDRIEKVRKSDFKLEIELQNLTEKNLDVIFRLEFVRREFQINDLRIDTLAFDPYTSSFVIIEYKKDENFSVIDQGFAYLSLLLSNKSDFILEYIEKTGKSLGKKEVDWSQSRIIFVSPKFTKFQRRAIGFSDLPMELWEVSKYSNDLYLFNQLISPESVGSIKDIGSKNKVVKRVIKEVKKYEEADSLDAGSGEVLKIYGDLRERIINLGDVEIRPLKTYVSFVAIDVFVSVKVYKTVIRIILNVPEGVLDDPKDKTETIVKKISFGKGNIGMLIDSEENLDYIMTLIKQSFDRNS